MESMSSIHTKVLGVVCDPSGDRKRLTWNGVMNPIVEGTNIEGPGGIHGRVSLVSRVLLNRSESQIVTLERRTFDDQEKYEALRDAVKGDNSWELREIR